MSEVLASGEPSPSTGSEWIMAELTALRATCEGIAAMLAVITELLDKYRPMLERLDPDQNLVAQWRTVRRDRKAIRTGAKPCGCDDPAPA